MSRPRAHVVLHDDRVAIEICLADTEERIRWFQPVNEQMRTDHINLTGRPLTPEEDKR